MEVVAGLSLRNLQPRVWDAGSPHYLTGLGAVMVSYAEIVAAPAWKRRAERDGLRAALGLPDSVRLYLDNGAFAFSMRGAQHEARDYEAFVAAARPDWCPVPHDFIPTPQMTLRKQRDCLRRTMEVNRLYPTGEFVSVLHASRVVGEYIVALREHEALARKPALAVGGLVPNLLRSPKSRPHTEVLDGLRQARRAFRDKRMHVFGIGGTATVHLAALLGFDSADSSGWRNRAARGIVQLPGIGDRLVAELGKWRGREPSELEWELLRQCPCPACQGEGLAGLRAGGARGFHHRATHNLSILLDEARWAREHLAAGSYAACYRERLDNSTYKPLIERVVSQAAQEPVA